MKKIRYTNKLFAIATVLVFISTNAFGGTIPENLGHVDEAFRSYEEAPLVIHIQSAHGNYEAEKNIQALLHYFTEKEGFDLLFLEGGVGRLDPRLFNLFPTRPELNLKVAEVLLKRAEMSGPELFLIENMSQGPSAEIAAYGIEETQAYRQNRKAFQQVLRQKEKTESFLQTMNVQIERLAAPYLNPALKNFLKLLEDYETKKMDFAGFLHFLQKEAGKRLEIDLDNPFYQKDWPMLIRFFRMEKLEPKLNREAIEKEKAKFFEQLNSYKINPDLLGERVGEGGVRQTFEHLLEVLPADFSFSPYENLRLHIQFLVLQSELEGELLFQEVERLQEEIAEKLARTETERKLLSLFRDYRFLRKLFALELTRGDYGRISSLRPSEIAKHFLGMNQEKRVKDIKFKPLEEIDRLRRGGSA